MKNLEGSKEVNIIVKDYDKNNDFTEVIIETKGNQFTLRIGGHYDGGISIFKESEDSRYIEVDGRSGYGNSIFIK